MRSGELASIAGVTVRTLRHYRTIGLLREPPRGENGYCEYSIDDLLRLLRIKHLASLGFSLDDIGGMLDTLDSDDRSKAADLLDELDRDLVAQIDALEQKRQTLALIRNEKLDADIPVRLAAIAGMLKEHGLPEEALKSERDAMLLAGAMLTETDLDETEAVYKALVERGLMDDYVKINDWIMELAPDANEDAKAAVIGKVFTVLEPLLDCFNSSNWDEEPTEAELRTEALFDQYQEQLLNPAQKEVCDRIIAAIQEQVTGQPAN
ncbi:MerR family transcriptional regulator [Raoultibacter phocaeensis]|uniref:MerR family transcriptional regulator n=1 Tax=Raoultibacter phocaeensis TaxID=2479841 RepID=UPI0015D5FBCF|nr:MerR family transcriptional regulator [Raoultibacter phocaeensis]